MENKSQSLAKGMLIYAIGNFGTKILSFLIVPLYTYYISTEDMGVYDLLLSTIQLLCPLITMQIADAAYSWIIRGTEDARDCIRSSMSLLTMNSVLAVLVTTVVHIIHPIPYFWQFLALMVSYNALSVIQKLLRGLKNQRLFATSGIAYTAIFLVLNVVQICVLHKGVGSLLISAFIANVLTIGLIYCLEKRIRVNFIRKPKFAIVKAMLAFAIPLIPNQLSWWVINSSDRYIITAFLGFSATGIFAIAHKFPSILQLVLSLFTTSWQDLAVADNDKPDTFYGDVFHRLYVIAFTLLLPVIPATKLVITWFMEDSYHAAAGYVAFLYLGTVFQAFSSFYGVGYLRGKDTKQASATSIYGALINIVVHVSLVKFIGLQAASVSTFLGFLVMWLIRERQNRKELNITIAWPKFLLCAIPVVILSVASCYTNTATDCILTGAGALAFLMINRNFLWGMVKKVLKKA